MSGGGLAELAQAPVPIPSVAPAEGTVEKYKRLLSLARSSLEANQATLAAKDAHIAELVRNMEDLRRTLHAQRGVGRGADDGLEAASLPRSLLRRVDVDDLIWVLVEFEGSDDSWLCFSSENELGDYIQRVQGVPLVAPPRSLTPTESRKIETESQAKVDQIVEEFRRYKLRSDIARKQKDAEARQALLRTSSPTGLIPGSSASKTGGAGNAGSASSSSGVSGGNNKGARTPSGPDDADETSPGGGFSQYDTEAKWRVAYETVVRENEQLRNRGGDMLLANQWRERYDGLLRERDDLVDKLRVYTKMDSGSGSTGKSIEQAYIDLKDEYKEFRWRSAAREQQRQTEIEDLKAALAGRNATDVTPPTGSTSLGSGGGFSFHGGLRIGTTGSDSSGNLYGIAGCGSSSSSSASFSSALGEAKHNYIRHMLLQYLSCREPEVKLHIEHALLAIFRFTEAERALIEERKKSEALGLEDLSLVNIGTMLQGSLGSWT